MVGQVGTLPPPPDPCPLRDNRPLMGPDPGCHVVSEEEPQGLGGIIHRGETIVRGNRPISEIHGPIRESGSRPPAWSWAVRARSRLSPEVSQMMAIPPGRVMRSISSRAGPISCRHRSPYHTVAWPKLHPARTTSAMSARTGIRRLSPTTRSHRPGLCPASRERATRSIAKEMSVPTIHFASVASRRGNRPVPDPISRMSFPFQWRERFQCRQQVALIVLAGDETVVPFRLALVDLVLFGHRSHLVLRIGSTRGFNDPRQFDVQSAKSCEYIPEAGAPAGSRQKGLCRQRASPMMEGSN